MSFLVGAGSPLSTSMIGVLVVFASLFQTNNWSFTGNQNRSWWLPAAVP